MYKNYQLYINEKGLQFIDSTTTIEDLQNATILDDYIDIESFGISKTLARVYIINVRTFLDNYTLYNADTKIYYYKLSLS